MDIRKDDEIKIIFARNLNTILAKHNKTQIEVADALGIKQSTFSSWCTGSKMPRMDKVQALSDYFGIMKSDLIEEKPATGKGDGLTNKQSEVYSVISDLNEEERKDVLKYIDFVKSKRNQ